MKNSEVYHFMFCEDTWDAKNPAKPFVCELLAKSIPFLFVSSISSFEIFLNKYFDEEDTITIWIHHQANHKKTDEFGRFLGETIGDDLIRKFPNVKFKYISRDPEHPLKSKDKNNTLVIFSNEIYDEINNPSNWQKISDFRKVNTTTEAQLPKEQSQERSVASTIGNVTNYGTLTIQQATSGESTTQSIEIKEQQLTNTLTQQGVSQEDIKELLLILKSDNHDKEIKKIGDKTESWIKKMINKAKNGSWAIAIGAAGKLLADAIKLYLGWA